MDTKILAPSLSFIVLAGLTSVGCRGEPLPEGDARGWADAFNRGDAAAVASIYAEDATLLAPNRSELSGRDAIHQEVDQNIKSDLKVEFDFTETESEGDTGYKVGTYELTVDGKVVDQGKLIEVWKRVDGEWLIQRDIYNSDLPHPPDTLSEDDVAAIRQAIENAAQYMQGGDFAAWAALHAEDATLMPPNHPRVTGPAAIQEYGEALPDMTVVEVDDLEIDGRENLAVARSTITMSFPLPDGEGEGQDTAKQMFVFEEDDDGEWRITAMSFNSDILLPSEAPAEAPESEAPEAEGAPAQ